MSDPNIDYFSGYQTALPYIDKAYDIPEIKEKVKLLMDKELEVISKPQSTMHDTIDKNDIFMTPILKQEFERVIKKKPLEAISMRKYEAFTPIDSQKDNYRSWQSSIETAQRLIEYHSIRLTNLELLNEYGSQAWRLHNYYLEKTIQVMKTNLDTLKRKVQEINFNRKNSQMKIGKDLEYSNQIWKQTTLKNFKLLEECSNLEAELEALKSNDS